MAFGHPDLNPVGMYDKMNASVRRANAMHDKRANSLARYEDSARLGALADNALMRQMVHAQMDSMLRPAPQEQAPASNQIPALAYSDGSAYQTNQGMTSGGMTTGGSTPPVADDKHWTNSLRKLMTDPASFQHTPGFKAALDTGRQAIERSFAARGMGNSGNVLAELMKYGTGLASQEYGNQVNRMAQLSQYEQGNPEDWINTQWGRA